MIDTITYVFPEDGPASDFYAQLGQLLAELPNANSGEDGSILLTPSAPQNSSPATVFKQESGITFPYMQIGEDKALQLQAGNLAVNPEHKADNPAPT